MFSTAHESEILLLMACKTTTTKKKKHQSYPRCLQGTDLIAEQQDWSWAGGQGGQLQRSQQQLATQLHLLELTPCAPLKAGKWVRGGRCHPRVQLILGSISA